MTPDYIIYHYSEIGLKGKNRKFFEEKLIENIKRVLKAEYFEFVRRISGRIIVKLTKKGSNNKTEIKNFLEKVFGLAFFAFAVSTKQDIKSIQEKALEILKEKKFKTFRIFTQRSKKDFPLTSQQINERVGDYILKNLCGLCGTTSRKNGGKLCAGRRPAQATSRKNGGKLCAGRRPAQVKVDLKNPDITCFIEIVDPIRNFTTKRKSQKDKSKISNGARNYAFLYLEKIKGFGGLPVGTSGKAVVLLSGGIDSPVAAFQTIKRGVKVIFLHFHAMPYTSKAAVEKAKKIVKILNEYQGKSKIYLVPFAKIQKEIFLKTPAKLRVILYRRFMLQIAEQIAKKEKALALVTGESIGQVASQTLENIKAIEEAVDLPILRPLIGLNKEEIISLAKKIGTFDVSILPHQDCCSRFLPSHPETKAKTQEVKEAEKRLNIEKLIKEAFKKTPTPNYGG